MWLRLSEAWGMDVRSLALTRIGLALTVLVDLIDRSEDLRAHYTDYGFESRAMIMQTLAGNMPSIYFTTGTESGTWILFLLHAALSLAFLVGYCTTISTAAVWFMTYSLQTRSYGLGHSGDCYLRIMLFFCIFLPMGDAFSIDSFLRRLHARKHPIQPAPRRRKTVCNLATVTYLVQILAMYIASVFHKAGPEWRVTGTSTWLALSLDYFRTPIGDLMAMIPPPVMTYLTFFVLISEVGGPVLLVVPVWVGFFRALGVIGIVMMHLSFGLGMRLGTFTAITVTASLVAIPSTFWDDWMIPFIRGRLGAFGVQVEYKRSMTSLLLAMREFLLVQGTATFSCVDSIHSNIDDGVRRNPVVVLRTAWGAEYYDEHAIMKLATYSPYVFPFALMQLTFLRLFHFFPAPRHASLNFMHSTPESNGPTHHRPHHRRRRRVLALGGLARLTGRLLVNALLLTLIGFILFWNAMTLGLFDRPQNSATEFIAQGFGLDQSWRMFSLSPPKESWWLVVHGELESGDSVCVNCQRGLHGRWKPVPLTFDLQDRMWDDVGNHRWFKMWETFMLPVDDIKLNFGRFICREYNSRNPHNRIVRHHIWKVWTATQNYAAPLFGGRTLLWDHICFDPATPLESNRASDTNDDFTEFDGDGDDFGYTNWPVDGLDGRIHLDNRALE